MGQNNLTSIGTAENQITMSDIEPISNSNDEPENINLISDVRNEENYLSKTK